MKAIPQIILCSFYLKATIYNLAAPGQPPIHKPAIIFPSEKYFCISAIKIFYRVKYLLARFRPGRNFLLASIGLNGPDRLRRGLSPHMAREPADTPPQLGCWGAASASAGIYWVHPGTSALPCPSPGDRDLWRDPFLAAVRCVRAQPGLWHSTRGCWLPPAVAVPRWGSGVPRQGVREAGPARGGLLGPSRPWRFAEQRQDKPFIHFREMWW